jgi:hypothetical protein
MKIASSTVLMLLGLTGALFLANTSIWAVSPHPKHSSKIAIKPPVTLQVRQNQAINLITKLINQQIVNINDDNRPEFSQSFDELKVTPLTGQDTDELGGYKYTIETKGKSIVLHAATPQLPKLRAYFGLVHNYTNSAQLKVSESIICASQKPSQPQQPIKIAEIAIRKGGLFCPTGYQKFIK